MPFFYVPVTIAVELDDDVIDSIDVETPEEFDKVIAGHLFREIVNLDVRITNVDANKFEYEYYPMNHPSAKESL